MKNNTKKTQNYIINTKLDLEKSTKWVSLTNLLLFKLVVVNLLILTYFYMQEDINFSATGWFQIPEKINWYYVFLGVILVRLIMVLTTHYFTEYIKNFSLWDEKKKKNALNTLAAINLLTIPINLPLIGSLIAYMKGSEVLSNNWFFGSFRRQLNQNEREQFYNETVENFLEKMEASKKIKDQLKNWSIENNKAFLEKYDDGSSFATKYISEKLESQKEFLQHEEIQNLSSASQIVPKEEHGLLSWIYDQTLHGLNYFNPFVTDYKTCVTAWGILIISGMFIFFVASNNAASLEQNMKSLAESHKNHLDLTINTTNSLQTSLEIHKHIIDNNQIKTDTKITQILAEVKSQQTSIKTLSEVLEQTQIQNELLQIKIDKLEKMATRNNVIGILWEQLARRWSPDKIDKAIKTVASKYDKEELSMNTMIEFSKECITKLLKF